MTSGVYKLTFPSGRTYIGKSINIENRWKQHYDSFCKCSAAKNMQSEYNRYGTPEGEILVECHPDHIDLVEACLIFRLRPELNTTVVPDPFTGIEDITNIVELLKMSTLEHLVRMSEWGDILADASVEMGRLTAKVISLEHKRSAEELATDINNNLAEYEEMYEELDKSLTEANEDKEILEAEIAELEAEISKLTAVSWWKRLFK